MDTFLVHIDKYWRGRFWFDQGSQNSKFIASQKKKASLFIYLFEGKIASLLVQRIGIDWIKKVERKWIWNRWGDTWRKEEVRRKTGTHPRSMDCLSGSLNASSCKTFVSISLNLVVSSVPSKSHSVYWFLLFFLKPISLSLFIAFTFSSYWVIQRRPISLYDKTSTTLVSVCEKLFKIRSLIAEKIWEK